MTPEEKDNLSLIGMWFVFGLCLGFVIAMFIWR